MPALVLAGTGLAGCPQLLDDQFDLVSAGGSSAGWGGGAGLSGAAGAGGLGASAAGGMGSGGGAGAGMGGGSENPDASVAGSGAGGTSADSGAAASGGDDGPDAGSLADTGPPGVGAELRELLLHRYRFDGSGSSVTDSVGTAHGAAMGATLGAGKLALAGSGEFVDLPNGLISSLQSVTLEAWVNWLADPASAAADWQTVFSFGSSSGGEDQQGDGLTYLYLTAQSGDSKDIRAGYSLNGFGAELVADGERALPASVEPTRGTQVVLVVDAGQGRLSIYIDGALEVATPPGADIDLAAIDDVNDWLGRSQYATDPTFAGEFLEFRIYSAALSAAQVASSFELGPDAEL